MDSRYAERLRKRISRHYDLLSSLDDRLYAVKRSRISETDPNIVCKLEKDEQEIQNQIERIENEITELNRQLRQVTSVISVESVNIKQLQYDMVQTGIYHLERIESDIAELKRQLTQLTLTAKAVEDVDVPKLQYDIIPTGIYHLFNPDERPLVRYEISNMFDYDLTVMATTQILGYSDMMRTTRVLKSNAQLSFGHLPILVPSKVEKLRAVKRATVHIRIAALQDPEEVLQDETFGVQIHPRDTIPWLLQNMDSGEIDDLSDYIAAWVTPHTKEIGVILRQAAGRHPLHAISGYQGGASLTDEGRREMVRSQIKAMFQVLKEETRITYVNEPITFGQKVGEAMQQVRLPRLSLEVRSVSCVDGTVLFASLIETANMNPVIILVPGHAFVGWETWQGSSQYDYLETTMTRDATFEEALTRGSAEYQDALGVGLFGTGRAKCINIQEARSLGIPPME